jgi:hypothetical protein
LRSGHETSSVAVVILASVTRTSRDG